mgnify:CR=1 FL=1|jgi:phasin family protein
MAPKPKAIEAAAIADTATAETQQPAPAATAPDGMETAMKTAEEFVAFGQANIEALAKSGQIWAAGVQDLSKQAAAAAQAQFADAVAAFTAFGSAKTFKDAVDAQAGFARAAFEKSMTESGKLTDASLKLAEQAIAPVAARVTVAMDKVLKAA